jgi:hypothetical protein
MGLHVTHDCWTGSCGAFNDWRRKLATAAGIDLDKMEGFCDDGIRWAALAPDPLHVLLQHSDCDGDIAIEHLVPLADRLCQLMSKLVEQDRSGPGLRWLSDLAITEQFVAGLRLAADLGQRVEFH